jgi:hypothetical protein
MQILKRSYLILEILRESAPLILTLTLIKKARKLKKEKEGINHRRALK